VSFKPIFQKWHDFGKKFTKNKNPKLKFPNQEFFYYENFAIINP